MEVDVEQQLSPRHHEKKNHGEYSWQSTLSATIMYRLPSTTLTTLDQAGAGEARAGAMHRGADLEEHEYQGWRRSLQAEDYFHRKRKHMREKQTAQTALRSR